MSFVRPVLRHRVQERLPVRRAKTRDVVVARNDVQRSGLVVRTQGEVEVDPNGTARVATPLPINPKAPQPRAAKLLCEVTDLSQQTVSESRAFVQHSSDYYFGFRRFDSVLKEGNTLPIELIAVASDGKVLTAPVKSTVRLTRITWQTNRLAAAGDTTEFDSKAELHTEWEREVTTTPGVGPDRKPLVATVPDAVAGKPDQYLLEATGKDAQGHDILTSMTFEVAGPGETVWNYRNPYAIDLVTDKESYAPVQTATIMVKTPIAGDALVTVERDRVLRSFLVKLTGNAPSVQVPLTEADAPNVFVSVMLLRGANDSPKKIKAPEYRIGYCEVKVARSDNKLAVTVKPSNPTARPGEKASPARHRLCRRHPANSPSHTTIRCEIPDAGHGRRETQNSCRGRRRRTLPRSRRARQSPAPVPARFHKRA